jgi:hypothetical protein
MRDGSAMSVACPVNRSETRQAYEQCGGLSIAGFRAHCSQCGSQCESGRTVSDDGKTWEATASKEFAVIQGAMLTLLGLIIAFSFSMAVSRYDLRESYEEAGANAIRTEYVRAALSR